MTMRGVLLGWDDDAGSFARVGQASTEWYGLHLQIQWRRALANATGAVVVGAVARAEPTAEVASTRDWHAAEVRADAQHNERLRLLGPVRIVLRVAQFTHGDVGDTRDLILCKIRA